ncbi:MAG: citrate synthase [Clostridiales bacterium]|nr:citrate synthase [Clostridiales bacterium]
MTKPISSSTTEYIHTLSQDYSKTNFIDSRISDRADIKRGLRNKDGTGVMAGVTQIGNVHGYYMQDGERCPMEGKLIYRGINVEDLIRGFASEGRFGFEETAYLLLMGELPNRHQLDGFNDALDEFRPLPHMFSEDMIIRNPSRDIMNKLGRSILTLYSYDEDPETRTIENELRLAMQLIARTPMIISHAYAAKRCYFDKGSLYLHRAIPGKGAAENILAAIREDQQYTDEEAKLLDMCLTLHAEHGGGNNSTFTCRVVSSSYTDIYASISAAVGSLKGPRHGGANIRCKQMTDMIYDMVRDPKDDDEIKNILSRILKGELFDHSGLIYGMGHAIYTLSDPRAKVLKRFARHLAEVKGLSERLDLIESVERLTPEVFASVKGSDKPMCANVDLYSGFVYDMLNIPEDLYTPLFATARMLGWCAHRIEEIYCNPGKIIRPAYKAIVPVKPFVPLDDRV